MALVSDLLLGNSGTDFGVIEVSFLPEVAYDAPPPVRRFVLTPQTTIRLDEVLATIFGIGAGRGALRIESYALPGTSSTALSASAVVRAASDPNGSQGAAVSAVPAAAWTSSGKQILDVPFGATTAATLVVANLDGVAGTVSFDLVDATGGYRFRRPRAHRRHGSAAASLDLFRNLGAAALALQGDVRTSRDPFLRCRAGRRPGKQPGPRVDRDAPALTSRHPAHFLRRRAKRRC
jgi:hypothetical protein